MNVIQVQSEWLCPQMSLAVLQCALLYFLSLDVSESTESDFFFCSLPGSNCQQLWYRCANSSQIANNTCDWGENYSCCCAMLMLCSSAVRCAITCMLLLTRSAVFYGHISWLAFLLHLRNSVKTWNCTFFPSTFCHTEQYFQRRSWKFHCPRKAFFIQ